MKIRGIVLKGEMNGRLMGFPTANLRISRDIYSGIYAGMTEIEGKNFKSAIYAGNKRPYILEVHIIGFSGDIYGREIIVSVGDKIRDDFVTDDKDLLIRMIREDVEKVKSL